VSLESKQSRKITEVNLIDNFNLIVIGKRIISLDVCLKNNLHCHLKELIPKL
jgi:hypothetical protein